MSYSNHYQRTLIESLNDLKSNIAIKQTINDNLPVLLGSWNFNYNSWKQLKKLDKYLLVKYEDLVKNTENVFENVLNFIKKLSKSEFEINRSKIKKSIETTSFERLKKLENEFGFSEAKTKKNGDKINFFNLGPDNKWEKSLEKSIKDEVEIVFSREMKELGYL